MHWPRPTPTWGPRDDGKTWRPLGRLPADSVAAVAVSSPACPGAPGSGLRAFWLDGRGMPGGGPMTLRSARVDPAHGTSGEVLHPLLGSCSPFPTTRARRSRRRFRSIPTNRSDGSIWCLDAQGDAIVSWIGREPGAPGEPTESDRPRRSALFLKRVPLSGASGPAIRVATTDGSRASGFPRLLLADEGHLMIAWPEPGSPGRLRAARLGLGRLERLAQAAP